MPGALFDLICKDISLFKSTLNERKEAIPPDEASELVFHAISIGEIELCKDLIRLGADIYKPDDDGFFALHYAAKHNGKIESHLILHALKLSAKEKIAPVPPFYIEQRTLFFKKLISISHDPFTEKNSRKRKI